MAFKLSHKDHRTMDAHLASLLNAYKDGDLELSQARASLAHIITAAAIDNESEFKKYIALSPNEVFKGD